MRFPSGAELAVLEPGRPGDWASDETIAECVRLGWASWVPDVSGEAPFALETTAAGELAARLARILEARPC